ncbi:MAG: signal peptide peptidase SppA [Chloroherpetonaceae bacterium]|nr:signal peptide peptidase SppA [Chloroherpetonaceae bacterium]MDW8438140.1 signal peptide peptidase SppA [Chloroherpetonaceae bacterium]
MAQTQRRTGSRKIWLVILALLAILFAIGVYRASSPKVSVPKEAVLTLSIRGSLPEVALSGGLPGLAPKTPPTLQGLLEVLDKAKLDERVKLIVATIEDLSTQQSKLAELRDAIADYRASGKEIWAFLPQLSGDAEYYLASACDKIFFERYGVLVLDGLKTEILYFKSMLAKVGIEFEVARRGKYKSAAESFLSDTISAPNYEQLNALLTGFDSAYVKGVTESRKISEEKFRRILNEQAYLSDKDALAQNLVDSICYFSELEDAIRKRFNVKEEDDETLFISASKYKDVSYSSLGKKSSDKIAVVNVMGALVDGKSDPSPSGEANSGDETIAPAIEEARKDKSVKAIVLRVDSPGGSAIASDKILRALNRAKAEKPVVASMSGVAASGGYWVSMQAQKIVANPTTITGSIGVIATKPAMRELADKIGLKRVVISKTKFADAFNLFDKVSPEAYQKADALIEYLYQEFLRKVAEGRNMTIEQVHSIAQGHVWLGGAAKNIGLVDELGGFRKAIQVAKNLAGIDETASVELVSYPKPKDFWEDFFENFGGASLTMAMGQVIMETVKSELTRAIAGESELPSEFKSAVQALRRLSSGTPLQPQALMPFEIIVK